MEIIPAILAKTEREFTEKLAAVPREARAVHIDFTPSSISLSVEGEYPRFQAGGRGFAPDTTTPSPPPAGGLRHPSSTEEGIICEAHLMVPHPQEHIAPLVAAGFQRVVVQVETETSPTSLRETPSSRRDNRQSPLEGSTPTLVGGRDVESFAALIHEWKHAVEIVPSLEIATPLEAIDSYAHELASVQLMGIAEIGAQGRPFDERVVARVRALHARYPKLIISVDGGVNAKNASALGSAGASRLVVGSAIGNAPDPSAAFAEFKNINM